MHAVRGEEGGQVGYYKDSWLVAMKNSSHVVYRCRGMNPEPPRTIKTCRNLSFSFGIGRIGPKCERTQKRVYNRSWGPPKERRRDKELGSIVGGGADCF